MNQISECNTNGIIFTAYSRWPFSGFLLQGAKILCEFKVSADEVGIMFLRGGFEYIVNSNNLRRDFLNVSPTQLRTK